MLHLQRAWLAEAADNDLQEYIPDLVRACSWNPDETENLSSAPMVEVTAAALSAGVEHQGKQGSVVIYDPACGAGGMLSAVGKSLEAAGFDVSLYGQDLNPWSAFVCGCSIWLSRWEGRTVTANSLAADSMADLRYDFAVAEPPFGLSWQSFAEAVHAGFEAGLFPGGLPQTSDSTLLFVQHLVTKMRPPDEGGGRAVILTAPSALRSAGGEEIRRWLLDRDLLEAVIGLPEGMASRTNIRLNALVLTNNRSERRRKRVQLVNLRGAFEDDPGSSLSLRRLRPDALDSLKQALSSVRSGPISRTVHTDRFLYRTVTVLSGRPDGQEHLWKLLLPATEEPQAFLDRHVKVPPSRVAEVSDTPFCRVDLDEVFNRDADATKAWIRERHWAATRLAAVASSQFYVRSAAAETREEALAGLPAGPVVMLPVEPNRAAQYGDPAEAAPDGRFFALTLYDQVMPAFIVGYLNSRIGVVARRVALEALGGTSPSPRTLSKSDIETLFATLVIPVPDLETQQRLVDAGTVLQAAATLAAHTAEGLWRCPEQSAELVRRVARIGQRPSLVEWARELPYPLATALWACEAQRSNPYAANQQLFLFWEATAEFIGTVLLSALNQDESLREGEMQSLRAALASQHLSMHRATLGVWMVLVQRLGSRFRTMLDTDESDERARVIDLFGGAPEDLLRALCGSDLVGVLSRVTQRRNDWSGHGGAVTEPELADRNAILFDEIETLRALFGDAWSDAPLVRAGRSAYKDGAFTHDVERAMGLNTPFLPEKVTVSSPMDIGALYVVRDGAQRGLAVVPFVQLRESPANAKFTCYFYNRLESEGARLVSYHLGVHDGDVVEPSPELSVLVAGFDAGDV
jgi:hypothetical protein